MNNNLSIMKTLKQNVREVGIEFYMPKGTYYLGDLCYAFDNEWMSVLEEFKQPCEDGRDYTYASGVTTYKGKPIAMVSTHHGDGVYQTSDCFGIAVDSGRIGLVDVSVVEVNPGLTMKKVTFDNDFKFMVNTNGTFVIDIHDKNIIIHTGFQDEYDEEMDILEFDEDYNHDDDYDDRYNDSLYNPSDEWLEDN